MPACAGLPPHFPHVYQSRAWKALRLTALQRDHHLCQECLRANKITRATTVHHKVPDQRGLEQATGPSRTWRACVLPEAEPVAVFLTGLIIAGCASGLFGWLKEIFPWFERLTTSGQDT